MRHGLSCRNVSASIVMAMKTPKPRKHNLTYHTMALALSLLLAFVPSLCLAQSKADAIAYILSKNNVPINDFLFISIKEQKLHYIKNNEIIKSYVISSSEYGTGSEYASNKTPLGLHQVKAKYGNHVPLGGRFIERVFYGNISTIYQDNTRSETEDILSRILWIGGLEKGINQGDGIDSYARYIYIHGTSEEGILGIPASRGCIRMKNEEIIELYAQVKTGTRVLIL